MYLVHARLRPPARGGEAPSHLRSLVYAFARPEDAVEHVSVHVDAAPGPVLGLFVLADSLAQAEANAEAVCARLLSGHPALMGWTLVHAEVPLLVLD
ncbi:hypothetical protein ABT236_30850 [Streptomyces sp. NPDC001523]|uniref:hypothetical protein n=1 Tax=Streptomyces sp. NPDC001523 TaxID=3154383 RepID=UPI0033305C56